MSLITHTDSLIRYWRKTLSDEELAGTKLDQSRPYCATGEIYHGVLPPPMRELLKKEWRDHLGKQQKVSASGAAGGQAQLDENAAPVPVVLLTRVFGPNHEHGRAIGGSSADGMHFTLQIPAIMQPSGDLTVHSSMTPWVSRRYMHPNHDNDTLPLVGDISVFDQYISKNPLTAQSFTEVLQWCDDLWQHLTEGRTPEGFVEIDRVYAVIADGAQGMTQNLCKLYDALEMEPTKPPLFAKICNGTEARLVVDPFLRISALSAPRGTMGTAYGLANSQSDAIAALSYLEDGEILAVNGPPGTGKTTLLQSIIATMVVQRAIAGGNPAVIVGASTNGQAVTNILESMNSILRENPSAGKFPWSKRWVPDAETYGLHLPAGEAQTKQGMVFAIKNKNIWTGFPDRENDPDYIQQAKNLWFQSYQKTYGSDPISLESGLATLQSDIQGLTQSMKPYANAWKSWVAETQWWQRMAGNVSPDGYISHEQEQAEAAIREKTDLLSQAISEQSQANLEHQSAIAEAERARISAVKKVGKSKSSMENLRHLKLSIGNAMLPQGGLENFCYLSFVFRPLFHQRRALRMEALRNDARHQSILGQNPLPEDYDSWMGHVDTCIMNSSNQFNSASAIHDQTVLTHQAKVNARRQLLENANASVSIAQKALDEVRKAYAERISVLQSKKKSLEASQQAIRTLYDQLCQRAESEFQATVKSASHHQEIQNADFDDVLDRTIRHACFQKAMRYWEGRWIMEAERLLTNESMKKSGGLSATEARFRRWCMLTPCLVSTAHSMPKHFQYTKPIKDKENNTQYDHPFLWSYIDLLIVDEAGQVGPHIGAGVFSLAKRAVVVGDIYQIEPVVTATSGTDHANAAQEGLAHLWENGSPKTPHISSEPTDGGAQGSIMRLAQYATKYVSHGTEAEPGIFLSEHRRCRKEIISYCNDLIYGGRLQPLSDTRKQEPPVRPMAYAHVRGEEMKSGGSRYNPMEATAIAQWIARNREAWVKHYDKPIEEIVAVVTPFKPQESALQKAMKIADTSLAKVTVGTVHKLQGAERQIVVFSPVYQYENAKSLFFDRKPNMLNVAVSRAKDSFVVIGDVRILDRKGASPSALLGKYLFADEENELQDVNVNVRLPDSVIRAAKRLSGLEPHREFLRKALTETTPEEVIVISSPWVKESAIAEDCIVETIRSSISKNHVKVFILVNKDNIKESEKPLVDQLRNAGAMVSTVNKLHSKLFIRGRGEIVEGSFNWLSAVRFRDSRYANYESSLWLSGEDAREAIRLALEDIKRDYNLTIPMSSLP